MWKWFWALELCVAAYKHQRAASHLDVSLTVGYRLDCSCCKRFGTPAFGQSVSIPSHCFLAWTFLWQRESPTCIIAGCRYWEDTVYFGTSIRWDGNAWIVSICRPPSAGYVCEQYPRMYPEPQCNTKAKNTSLGRRVQSGGRPKLKGDARAVQPNSGLLYLLLVQTQRLNTSL